MPSWHELLEQPRLGRLLVQFREENGLSQDDLAPELGVSQSYLSRLEAGSRSPSPSVAKRIAELLTEGDEVGPLDDHGSSDGELEDTYDRALIAQGSGDAETAEALLEWILGHEPGTGVSKEFFARTRIQLANIRRDRFKIDGEGGARALYREALGTLLSTRRLATVREVTFLQGACHEMQRHHRQARSAYSVALAMAIEAGSEQAIARAKNRLAVLATKAGEYAAARELLDEAFRRSLHLESPVTHGFVAEKLAILDLRTGNADAALSRLLGIQRDLQPADYMRRVQSHTVIADAYLVANDTSEAEEHLRIASGIAEGRRLAHQLAMINALHRRIT